MRSIFLDKDVIPTTQDLKVGLDNTFDIWNDFIEFTKSKNHLATEEWNYSSEKCGWSFRLKDKKRVIIYLLPRDKFFKIAFVFGDKATNIILKSNISETIKSTLISSKKFAEGKGIRVDVKDKSNHADIQKLISIKISN